MRRRTTSLGLRYAHYPAKLFARRRRRTGDWRWGKILSCALQLLFISGVSFRGGASAIIEKDGVAPATTIITTFLGSFPRTHISETAFRNIYVDNPTGADAMAKLQDLVDSVGALREAGADNLRLVVINDIPDLAALANGHFEAVTLSSEEVERYRTEWHFLGANDVRFVMERDYLRSQQFRDEECLFAVDASDVRALRHPGLLCAGNAPGTLFVGNDVSGTGFCRRDTKAGRWSKVLVVKTHYAFDEPEIIPIMNGESGRNHTFVNCGIIGGTAPTLRYYLERAGDIFKKREPRGLMRPLDMVIVNHLAAVWPNATVSGFPEGPVNLPFHHQCRIVQPPCDYDELAATGRFFFSHK